MHAWPVGLGPVPFRSRDGGADTRPTAKLYLYLRGGKEKSGGLTYTYTREKKRREKEEGIPPSLFHLLLSSFTLLPLFRRGAVRTTSGASPDDGGCRSSRGSSSGADSCSSSRFPSAPPPFQFGLGKREEEEEEEEEVVFGLSSVGSSAGWRKAASASASVGPKGTLLLKSVGKKKKSEAHFLRSRALPSCLAADSVWGFFSFPPPPPLPFLLWPNRNKSSN